MELKGEPMNEGVPVRTIATLVIVAAVVAGIVSFLLIRFFAPPAYIYSAAHSPVANARHVSIPMLEQRA
jgi:hypothetical protein